MLIREDKLAQEMSQLLAEFYNSIRMKYMTLTDRHGKERKLLLDMQWKERKTRFRSERKQKLNDRRTGNNAFMVKGNNKITQGTKKPKIRKHERLFLDDPAF